MPAVPQGVAGRALDPTEVIPRPRPVQPSEPGGARVISGEVVGSRHRARRARRPGPGSAVTVVLSATGAVAGLSLLMPHGGSSDTAQAHPPQPLKSSAEDMADAVSEPVATGSVVGAKADVAQQASASDRTDSSGASTATTTSTTSTSSAVTAASTTTGSGRHARAGGTWDTNDWQEAIARAAAAQRAAQQDQTGRHRAPIGFGYQGSPDSQSTQQP
ncbi:MAG: hypothetical protein QOF44_3558 [Streptomyces sp.]|jgi:hypothetical protein|nr:hypothetical protein [Streptomyces sp.]